MKNVMIKFIETKSKTRRCYKLGGAKMVNVFWEGPRGGAATPCGKPVVQRSVEGN